jgi:hypothetical protein
MNPRVQKINIESAYVMSITFTNGEEKIFDFGPYLSYPIYEPLKDESFFKKAKIFDGIVLWDESTDFNPDTLYLESKPKEVN